MPTYSIQAPNGKTYRIDGPAGANDDQVRAQVLRQFPEAGGRTVTPAAKPAAPKPAPVPVQTRDQQIQNIARRKLANEDQAFTLEKTPVIGNVLKGLRDSGDAGMASLNDWLPFDLGNRVAAGVNRIAANVRSATGAPAAAENGKDFQDAVRIQREISAQRRARSTVGNIAGGVVGAVGGGAGLARAGTAAVSRAVASGSNVLQALGKGAQAVGTLQKGQRVGNALRLAGQGAGYAAVDSAADANAPGKIAQDAAVGAIAAPVLVGAAKSAAWLARPVADFLGLSGAANVLRRFTSSTAEEVQQRAADFRAANRGVEPTIYEVLSPADQQRVAKAVGIMPDKAREIVASSTRQRAANMGPELQTTAQDIIAPAQGQRTAQIADDLAGSRVAPGAPPVAPTPEDTALATSASRSPVDMQQVRANEARNIMAPHDNTPIATSVNDLVPSAPFNNNGQIEIRETDPDISSMIRRAAGALNISNDNITVRNVTQILSKLRKTVGNGGTEGDIAQAAINHIEGGIRADHPEIGAAIDRMNSAYAGRSRMMSGVGEGGQTRLRQDVPVNSNRDALNVRNAYDTPEGSTGRALGQASNIEQRLAGTPDQVVTAANDIANSPSTQAAISANLGANEGQQIANAANSQVGSAQAFGRLNADAASQGSSLGDMMKGLLALSPGTLPHTKAVALSRIMQGGTSLPSRASENIVNSIFSQNPTSIARGLKMLNNLDDTTANLFKQVIGGIIGAQTATSIPDPQVAPADPSNAPQPVDPNQIAELAPPAAPTDPNAGGGAPVDPNSSPYAEQLNQVYQTENPDVLDLIDRQQQQESGGDPGAVSSAGAVGLMQVMPGTGPEAAKLAGVPWDANAYHNDPVYQKLLGIGYFTHLLEKYDGQVEHALAAYNAGPGRVDKALSSGGADWLSQLPAETQDYVAKLAP